MNTYKLMPHVADVRLEIQASSLEELFNTALQGMAELIKPGLCSETMNVARDLAVTSVDTTTLLIDFMSDVLTQTHINKVIYYKAEFKKLTPTELQATVFGTRVTDGFDQDVKSVTYHEADVKKNAHGDYQTTIVFDI